MSDVFNYLLVTLLTLREVISARLESSQYNVEASDSCTGSDGSSCAMHIHADAQTSWSSPTLGCILIIDQGFASFTGYGYRGVQDTEPVKCKSHVYETNTNTLAPLFNSDGVKVPAVKRVLTNLYKSCYADIVEQCQPLTEISVYQTGRMQTTPLAETNVGHREQWRAAIVENINTVLESVKSDYPMLKNIDPAVNFDFLAASEEAQLKGTDFFTHNPRTAIGFHIGWLTTQAWAKDKDGSLRAVRNELLGVKPESGGAPETKYTDMEKAFLTLLQGATGLEDNMDGPFKVVIAQNAIRDNMNFVMHSLRQCAYFHVQENESFVDGCTMNQDVLERAAVLKIWESYEIVHDSWDRGKNIDVNRLKDITAWASEAYKSEDPLTEKYGYNAALLLNSFARAVLWFGIREIIIEHVQGNFRFAGEWTRAVMSKRAEEAPLKSWKEFQRTGELPDSQ